MKYIYQNTDWAKFFWNGEKILKLLSEVKLAQGFLLGKMSSLGFEIKNNALVNVLTENILKSSEIEGEILNAEQVRSSISRKLGLEATNISLQEEMLKALLK
jgi:Fic family protein